tara:strand:+ start:1240 stop:1539 length:300 start_codon:yes stop_codon:yes gene_type:complete
MALPNYIRETDQGVTLAIRVQPRASRDEIIADRGGEQLKVRITAAPVDSAANKVLIKFIAKSLGVPPRTVSLIRGDKNRSKVLLIVDTNAASVLANLHK